MRIILNANNLIIGGGLTIGRGITDALLKSELKDEIHIFLPYTREYDYSSKGNISVHHIPQFFKYFPLKRFFIELYLIFKVKLLKPDVIFSLGNYAIPASCPQLLLLQWPYAVYPEKEVWSKMTLMDYYKRKVRLFLFRKNLRYASALTVQTERMKERVKKYLPVYKGPLYVVPSSFNNYSNKGYEKENFYFNDCNECKRLLCMSEYYSHKNLEVLLDVADLIKRENIFYKIILTIEGSKYGSEKLLNKINKRALSDVIINIGRVKKEKIWPLYHDCDALLLPTMIESFGIPYLEAAFAKLPVITSDRDFAHEINGDNAWYFNPLSADSIVEVVQQAFADPILMKEKVERAFLKVSKMKSWEEITKEYLEIIRNLT